MAHVLDVCGLDRQMSTNGSDSNVDPSKEEILARLRQRQRDHEQHIVSMLIKHAQQVETIISGKIFAQNTWISSEGDRSTEESKNAVVQHSTSNSEGIHTPLTEYTPPNLLRLSASVTDDDQSETLSPPTSKRRPSFAGDEEGVRACTSLASRVSRQYHDEVSVEPPKRFLETPVHPIFLRMVKATVFETFTITIVVLNTIALAVQVDWAVRHEGEEEQTLFAVVEISFTVIFSCELLIRILASGKQFLSCHNSQFNWNLFDTLLVFSSLLEVPLFLVLGTSVNLTGTRLLRLLRLVRMLRMVRLFRFFKMLRLVVSTVAASMKPLLWALALLFCEIFVSAALILQLIQGQVGDNENVKKYYGGLLVTMYTLFGCLTDGRSWQAVAEPLIELSAAFFIFFVLFMSFSIYCIANIVTSIFVESAKAMNLQDEEMVLLEEAANREAWLRDIRHAFEAADRERSGELTADAFVECMQDIKIQVLMKNLGIDVLSINPRGLFSSLDFDNSGSISIDEFADGIMRFHGQARSLDLAEVRHFVLIILEGLEECKKLVSSQNTSSAQLGEPNECETWTSSKEKKTPKALPNQVID